MLGIQVARRLVRQHNRRLIDQRPRQSHALLLASGKLRRPVVQPFLQTEQADNLREVGPVPRAVRSRNIESDINVGSCIERRQQIEFLEYKSDFALPHLGSLSIRVRGKIRAIKNDMPRVSARQTAKKIEQSRFAAP